MLPTLNIFGFEIATYGVLIFIGLIIGSLVAIFHFSKFYNLEKEDVFYAILYAIIGLGIGSKLLYLITNIPFIIENYESLNLYETFTAMFKGGFVFYGGLIGAIIGIFIYSKQFKIPFKKLILTIFPVIPLVHSIGRLGCFCAGCCYGIEYHGKGSVVFSNTNYAPVGVELFPSQLLESLLNFIIFIILLLTYKKWIDTYKTISLYCILYSICRFILEFFRGDLVRGSILWFSTSQWISVIVFIIGLYIFIKEKRKNTV